MGPRPLRVFVVLEALLLAATTGGPARAQQGGASGVPGPRLAPSATCPSAAPRQGARCRDTTASRCEYPHSARETYPMRTCSCVAEGGHAARWQCFEHGPRGGGPLAPPELDARA